MRIAQYLGGAAPWGDVTPETMLQKGMGGRETALVRLAERWRDAGHEVVCFVPTENPYRSSQGDGSLQIVTNGMARPYLGSFGADVLVSWEEPRVLAAEDVRKNVTFGCVEMQVAHVDARREDGSDLAEGVDAWMALSEWHKRFFLEQNPNVEESSARVLPNGVDLSLYPEDAHFEDRLPDGPPYRFFYSSSPDRGLAHMLTLWPRMLAEWPGSTLTVAYGIEAWCESQKWTHHMQCETALAVQELVRLPGVVYVGKIGQAKLAKIQRASHALLYPCDTMQPTETGCITAIEAGAAYSPMVSTDCDCLGEEFGGVSQQIGLPWSEDAYLQSVRDLVEDPQRYAELSSGARKLAEERSWERIARSWLEAFEEAC